jgi:UDP-N-acetylglucosamine:LPS N-acetylglucosamine transferase
MKSTKKVKDAELMDLMKRLTVIKRKIEKRLKGRPDRNMNKIIIVGGSRGIGKEIINDLVDGNIIST